MVTTIINDDAFDFEDSSQGRFSNQEKRDLRELYYSNDSSPGQITREEKLNIMKQAGQKILSPGQIPTLPSGLNIASFKLNESQKKLNFNLNNTFNGLNYASLKFNHFEKQKLNNSDIAKNKLKRLGFI